MTSATMLESGINSVAAALTLRQVASMGIEAKIRITGEGMNHRVEIALPDGRQWLIENARQWFEVKIQLRAVNGREVAASFSGEEE